jgi:hypothetical protein
LVAAMQCVSVVNFPSQLWSRTKQDRHSRLSMKTIPNYQRQI